MQRDKIASGFQAVQDTLQAAYGNSRDPNTGRWTGHADK